MRICKECGKPYKHTSSNQRYCSEDCRNTGTSKLIKERYLSKTKKQYNPGVVTCLRCGRKFKSWDKILNRRCGACAAWVGEISPGVDSYFLETATDFG